MIQHQRLCTILNPSLHISRNISKLSAQNQLVHCMKKRAAQHHPSSSINMTEKIKVAILDDYQSIAASKFSHLTDQVEVHSFPETLGSDQKDALITRLRPFTIICTMRERTAFPADVLSSLPKLKLLTTTGLKNAAIDLPACTKQGIIVVGAKGTGKPGSPWTQNKANSLDSTMEHAWGLILGLTRNISRDDFNVKHRGAWEMGFATALKGRTLSVLGLGKLGADTARIGVAFGMKVLAWSANLDQKGADEKAKGMGLTEGTFRVAQSKEELFQEADVLSIHYVLSERSRVIVGAKELGAMKKSALLVNTSRAPLVDEKALLECLMEGRIKGAGLDVYYTEPLPKDSVWRTTEWGVNGRSEVVLSPHMGYGEEGVMHRWYEDTVQNIEDWLAGNEISTKMN